MGWGVAAMPRLDLLREVRAHRALGISEAAAKVDDEHGRTLAERHALPETGTLVDLSRFVAHADHPVLVVEGSSSPKRARFTNLPSPGFPTSLSPSTITCPRTSTTSGAPLTSVPSKRL